MLLALALTLLAVCSSATAEAPCDYTLNTTVHLANSLNSILSGWGSPSPLTICLDGGRYTVATGCGEVTVSTVVAANVEIRGESASTTAIDCGGSVFLSQGNSPMTLARLSLAKTNVTAMGSASSASFSHLELNEGSYIYSTCDQLSVANVTLRETARINVVSGVHADFASLTVTGLTGNGSAVYVGGESTVFTECIIRGNSGNLNVLQGGLGDVTLTDCVFENNTVDALVHVHGTADTNVTQFVVTATVFHYNRAVCVDANATALTLASVTVADTVGVSAVRVAGSASSVTSEECVFEGNDVGFGSGGALWLYAVGGDITFSRTNFTANSAANGGAVYVENRGGGSGGSVVFCDCVSVNNSVSNFGGVVATYRSAGSLLLYERCVFVTNSAVRNGGSLYDSYVTGGYAPFIVRNCSFDRDSGSGGESIDFDHSITLSSSNFTGGVAAFAMVSGSCTGPCSVVDTNFKDVLGGGIYADLFSASASLTVSACTFTNVGVDDMNSAVDVGVSAAATTPIVIEHVTVEGGQANGVRVGSYTYATAPLTIDTVVVYSALPAGRAGIHLQGLFADIRISDSVFDNGDPGVAGSQAGIFMTDVEPASILISNTSVSNTRGVNSGGIDITTPDDGVYPPLVISDCYIANNYGSSSVGGGGACVYRMTYTVVGTTFVANSGSHAGGLSMQDCYHTLYNVTIDDSFASADASAAEITFKTYVIDGLFIRNCRGSFNVVWLYDNHAGSTISNVVLENVGQGASTHILRFTNQADITVTNVHASGMDSSGENIHVYRSNIVFTNCTFTDVTPGECVSGYYMHTRSAHTYTRGRGGPA